MTAADAPAGDRRADLGCLALLGLAVAALFPGAVAGGVFFVQDVMVQNVPFRHFLHQALAEGRLPLWEPAVNCGFPLLAEGQVGALYPPNWIGALLLSPAAAVTWSVLCHLWLAAAGTWGFLRALGCGRLPALTGALTYGLGGYLVVRAMSPNFVAAAALLPILFLLLETGLSRGRPLRVGLAGGVVALQLLAGHPQAAAYGALAAAGYGALRVWQLGLPRPAGAGLLALTGVAMSAVQVLPTYELAAQSLRADGIDYGQFVNMSLPPERLVSLLLPDFFGNPATGSYWGRQAGFFIQLCPYVGVVGLILALIAVRESRSPVRGAFAVLAVLGLGLSLGEYSGLFQALHQIPVLNQLRIPTRFLLWWAFAAAVLAGLGAQRLVDPRPLRSGWLWIVALLALAGGLATSVHGPDLWTRAGLTGTSLAQRYRADLASDLARTATALVAVALVAFTGLRRRLSSRWLAAVLALLTWVELRDFGGPFNTVLEADVYEGLPPAAQAITTDAGRWRDAAGSVPVSGRVRVASLVSEDSAPYDWHSGWAHDTTSYARYPGTLRMYTAGLFGLANTLPGWSPLHDRRHWQLASGDPAMLGMANAGYLVSHQSLASPDLELLWSGQERVYRNLRALPRAYVVPEAVVIPEARRRLSLLRSRSFDPHRAVVLERSVPVPPASASGYAPARVTSYQPRQVDIELPGRDGFLVLADTEAPGWVAHVDGQPRQILTGNHVFRALPVTANERRVRFRYQPRSVYAGAAISLAAALLWLVGLLWARRWPRHLPRRVAPRSLSAHVAVQILAIIILYGVVREPALWRQALDRLGSLTIWLG